MAQIFAYITHKDGVADDSAIELKVAAKKIDADTSITAIVTGSGAELEAVCNKMAVLYNDVWKIDGEAFSYPNAELIQNLLVKILPPDSILLIAHDTFSMDLSPGLSIKIDSAFASDVVDIESVEGTVMKIIRQEFGGQIGTHVTCDISSGAVLSIRPGTFLQDAVAFPPDESGSARGAVVSKSHEVGDITVGRRYLETVAAEAGDVDITKKEVLVSIGRGIEDEENIKMAQELADAMGGIVSCSRPVVDAKWLEKSRQVGTSGQTVKPNVYLACGISGSFQHIGGIKGNPFIVAINKNPKAPIFQVADIGIVDDILDFMPKLTEKIRDRG